MKRQRALKVSAEFIEQAAMPPPDTGTISIHGQDVEITNPPYRAVRVVRGLPAGARLVGARTDAHRDLLLVFEHESFEEIAEGAEPPVSLDVLMGSQNPRMCCFGHECAVCVAGS